MYTGHRGHCYVTDTPKSDGPAGNLIVPGTCTDTCAYGTGTIHRQDECARIPVYTVRERFTGTMTICRYNHVPETRHVTSHLLRSPVAVYS
jgi:hypothetical protein